jgi:eukaryotic-like serine/threonine-protein kinase
MWTPQAGEQIAGRYRLERELARGGMGSVWAGHDTKLRRKVAVKLVAPDWAAGEQDSDGAAREANERFEREAMAVAQLQSPHVVQIFDYGLERAVPYIVMELLEGEDLRSRLHRLKRVSLETAALILVQTAKALSVAHAAGIIHRDLKPGNIFLVRAGEEEIVKVLDFGVAMQVTDLLERDDPKVMGTPQFMSPEQARGLPDLDHRADLWSLGIIVYKALTGRLPFQGGSPTDVIVKVCTTEAAPISKLAPDLPRELDGFFAKALARDPMRRFGSAREMALAFSRISPVNFTTLSMPDPKAIEEAIARARAAGAVDDDDAETLAVDALTMLQLDDGFLEDLKTKMITPELIASRLRAPRAASAGARSSHPAGPPSSPTAHPAGPSPSLQPPQRGALPLRAPSRPPPSGGAPATLRYPPGPMRGTTARLSELTAPRSAPPPPVGRGAPALLPPPRTPLPAAPSSPRAPSSLRPPLTGAPASPRSVPAAPASASSSPPGPASRPSSTEEPSRLPPPSLPGRSASRSSAPPSVVIGSSGKLTLGPGDEVTDHHEEGEGRTAPPSSRTLTALEREPGLSLPPPQTRKALAMAMGAVAAGVIAAVIGSALFRGPDVAAFGLVAGLDDARSALRVAAAKPSAAEAASAEDPPPATEPAPADPEPEEKPTDAERHASRNSPPGRPAAAPRPSPPPVAAQPPSPAPPTEPAKKPVDVFSERL